VWSSGRLTIRISRRLAIIRVLALTLAPSSPWISLQIDRKQPAEEWAEQDVAVLGNRGHV
jgi:hypothetical protein